MKAIYRSEYGSSEVLELKDVEKISPKDNQLLIKVYAASLNPLDWHILRGEPFLVRLMGFGLLKPKHNILGADMAGRVEAVGKDVTNYKVGDEIFGSGMGGFAEYACLNEKSVSHKATNMSFEQAASVPVAALTALQALRDRGKLKEGQEVLINGASGGVGTFAVQIAKAMKAHVTGVSSGKNVELVKSIGADQVIDYTKEDYWSSGKQYDLIVDNAAFYAISKPIQALKSTGVYVVVGGDSSTAGALKSMIINPMIAKMKGKKVLTFIANVNQADLEYMVKLFEAGKVTPVIEKTYQLEETPQAISYIEEGHTRGKVVIRI